MTTIPVFVGVYSHRHGIDAYTYSTRESVDAAQVQIAKEYWAEDRADMSASDDPNDLEDAQVIEAYFDGHDKENFDILESSLTLTDENIRSVLAGLPVEDLVAELNRRSGVVASVWTQDDLMVDFADAADAGTNIFSISSEQREALAAMGEDERSDLADSFLGEHRKYFEQTLAEAGNGYITNNLPEYVREFLSETQGIDS